MYSWGPVLLQNISGTVWLKVTNIKVKGHMAQGEIRISNKGRLAHSNIKLLFLLGGGEAATENIYMLIVSHCCINLWTETFKVKWRFTELWGQLICHTKEENNALICETKPSVRLLPKVLLWTAAGEKYSRLSDSQDGFNLWKWYKCSNRGALYTIVYPDSSCQSLFWSIWHGSTKTVFGGPTFFITHVLGWTWRGTLTMTKPSD